MTGWAAPWPIPQQDTGPLLLTSTCPEICVFLLIAYPTKFHMLEFVRFFPVRRADSIVPHTLIKGASTMKQIQKIGVIGLMAGSLLMPFSLIALM